MTISGKKQILLIDDEKTLSSVLKRLLEATGDYQVATALDGRSGLVLARRINPDLIVLDTIMPEMDGVEVLKRLQDDRRTREIPVIILSGYTDIGFSLESTQLRYDLFLPKPIKAGDLIAGIRKVLEDRRAG